VGAVFRAEGALFRVGSPQVRATGAAALGVPLLQPCTPCSSFGVHCSSLRGLGHNPMERPFFWRKKEKGAFSAKKGLEE
jgi:hypothetical protein